jgi:hypothetical protein
MLNMKRNKLDVVLKSYKNVSLYLDYLTNINKLKIATNVVLELQLDVL